MQIYAEAESNANEFALACFVRRRREAKDSRIQRAEHVMQAVGLVLPRRNSISAAGKLRRSREQCKRIYSNSYGRGHIFVPEYGIALDNFQPHSHLIIW